MNTDAIKRVAIIGAGLMGHGIAQVFGCQGYRVAITDANHETLQAVPEKIKNNLKTFLDLGLADPGVVGRCLQNITLCPEIKSAVKGSDLVIETVSERLDLKQEVLREVEKSISREAIICTNTSAIRITELAGVLQFKERFVGAHFWNPPHILPCVEVIQGEDTSKETFETVYALMEKIGKVPVRVRKDVPGFIGNRLLHALWREAISLYEKNVASPEDIDKVAKYGLGVRMPFIGPFETADLAGLNLVRAVEETIFPHLDASQRPSPVLESLVAEGATGVKTGRGFYEWPPEKAQKLIRDRDAVLLRILHGIVPPKSVKG
jgi:3-hydroxybutyryl-CoA dehydrogenase